MYRGQAAPALLGTYRVTSASLARMAVGGERPDIDGGDNGWWLVKGKIEGGITLQLDTDASPTLELGDFFKTSVIFRDAAGNPVTQICVLNNPGPVSVEANGFRAQAGSARVDQFPTETVNGIDEYAA